MPQGRLGGNRYLQGVGGLAPLLIFGAPGGVGTLRPAAGAAPVPLAAIAEEHLHPQPLLEAEFKPVKPSGTRPGTHPSVSLSEHLSAGNRNGEVFLYTGNYAKIL